MSLLWWGLGHAIAGIPASAVVIRRYCPTAPDAPVVVLIWALWEVCVMLMILHHAFAPLIHLILWMAGRTPCETEPCPICGGKMNKTRSPWKDQSPV